MPKTVAPSVLAGLMKDVPAAEGARRVLRFVREGLGAKKFNADNFSYKTLGFVLGAIDPYNEVDSFRRTCAQAQSTEMYGAEALLTESNPGVSSNAFQIITGELIASKMIEGYETEEGWIGDQLVTVMPNQRLRNQRIAGITALAGPEEVKEGHPYPESGFEEKYVTTSETKKGRILSLNEELLLLDQTGEVNRRAVLLGYWCRQERERTLVRGVIDADASTNPVYRPSGSGTTLYVTTGANRNYIGVSNTTSSEFNAAVALEDWTDLDVVFDYRSTEVVDDRVDGTQRAIMGLLTKSNVLLVPERLAVTADMIVNATFYEKNTNSAVVTSRTQNNVVASRVGAVLSSPFVDEVNDDDWYYGNFKKQFVWTELMPLTVTTQGRDSEAAFERDVALRVKVRYWGGITAVDKIWVTKVDGA